MFSIFLYFFWGGGGWGFKEREREMVPHDRLSRVARSHRKTALIISELCVWKASFIFHSTVVFLVNDHFVGKGQVGASMMVPPKVMVGEYSWAQIGSYLLTQMMDGFTTRDLTTSRI